MHDSHHEKVFMAIDAECWARLHLFVQGSQLCFQAFMLAATDIDMKESYPIYFALDLVLLLPQLWCLCVIHQYRVQDSPLKRQFTPMAALIMIGCTTCLFFQSLFMIIKNQQESVILQGQGKAEVVDRSLGKD